MPEWDEIASLPNKLGVAGPFAGVHKNALIVAGGANFKEPIWQTEKVWYDEIYALTKKGKGYQWHNAGKLPRKTGYGATVSTPNGIVCMGGNDGTNTFKDAYILVWNPRKKSITAKEFPSLPQPCAYGQAVYLDGKIYLAGGQSDNPLDSAMKNFWMIDTKSKNPKWEELKPWPGPNRAFNLLAVANNGTADCIYLMSGRRQNRDKVQFLTDNFEFNPDTGRWKDSLKMPFSRMAGTAIQSGKHEILVLGGADGSLWHKAPGLGPEHPGFPKEAWRFNAKTGSWQSAGPIPANHVTTIPVRWQRNIIIPSGEVRPRIRSPKIWSIRTGR